MTQPLLVEAKDLKKSFHTGSIEVPALRGISLELRQGEFAALVGPSGSGKSTLLNLIGALDSPSGGELKVLGQPMADLDKEQRSLLRLHSLGFVFQAYNLVPVLSAQENVEFVLELQGKGSERHRMAREALNELGMLDLAERLPAQLSGGQQQRVAVARAIVSKPQLVLADEPTANLDGSNAESLMEVMHQLRQKHGMTFLFSTHDPRVIGHADRIITLEDGRVASDRSR